MEWWKKQCAVLDEKAMRERVIIALLVLAVMWTAFNFIFFAPLEKQKATLHERLTAVEKDMKTLSALETVLAKGITNDPNAQKKKEIERLEKKLSELEQSLQALSVGLIPAEELPLALHDVLQSIGSLKLVGMETLAPSRLQLQSTELFTTATDQTSGEGREKALEADEIEHVGVFKHSVIVALEGQYFDVVSYLRALESLPWKIYWHSIDYEVLQYPKAKVLIEVYTLSTEEGVLGV